MALIWILILSSISMGGLQVRWMWCGDGDEYSLNHMMYDI